MILANKIIAQCEAFKLDRIEDPEIVEEIARLIAPPGWTDAEMEPAIRLAARAIHDYRLILRIVEGEKLAASLPVRNAVEAGDGGGRYYWRVVLKSGSIVSAVADEMKSRGDMKIARKKAATLFADGITPVELIPPDIDTREELTRNRSGSQPAGLTVRQREKKH